MVRRRAFTLIELLVVVAIIALLIAILIPALSRAKDNAKKALCGTHLKGQGSAFAVYAGGNNDNLPSVVTTNAATGAVTPDTSSWLHDQSFGTVGALMAAAQTSAVGSMSETSLRKWFYCPTNPEANTDNAWNGINPNNANQSLGRPFLDYNYFNKRGSVHLISSQYNHAGSAADSIVRQTGALPNLQIYPKMSILAYASSAELACDEICSNNSASPDFSQALNTNISYFGERSSHLKGVKPTGMNALAFDGSVTWRGTNPSTVWDAGSQVGPTPIQAAKQTDQTGMSAGQAVMWFVDP